MKIVDHAVDRSTTVFVALILIVVIGLRSYVVLPREAEPDIQIPFVIVSTSYQGVAPADMESLVTIPIERKLTGLSGVKEIRSSSAEGDSTIQIEFLPDVDIDDAMQKVRDKVDMATQDLPEDADEPVITEINLSELPVIFVSLTGDVGLAAMTRIAEDLEDAIETIKGVLDVEIVGDVEREIQIVVDPERVAEYGVPLTALVTLMRVENVNTPSGSLELGEGKYLMRVPGEFKGPDDIRDLVVKADEKGIVYLRDIAEIKDGFKEVASLSRLNGQPAITLTVSRRSGENVIAVADAVKQAVEEANRRLPPGVNLTITMDESTDIRDMVADLENNILSGLILVLAVIFAFLGFVEALLVASAIPISMLVTFAVLHMFDITLNMVVLFSLILALGMLVDNGIVVVENIHRHMQLGYSRVEAAKAGAAEVAWPIIGSTVTTVVAFVPMFFWPGIWGEFMVFLPITVITSLSASLFVGLVVNPAMAARFMRVRANPSDDLRPRRGRLMQAYGAFLRLSLRWPAVTFTLAAALLVVITGVFFQGAKIEFTPETEPHRGFVDIDCPEGTNLETTDGFVRHIEELVAPFHKNLEFLLASVGSRGVSRFGGGKGGQTTHVGRVTLDFPKFEECTVLPSEIVNQARGKFDDITGAEVRMKKSSMGPSDEPPVNIEISGDDFSVLTQLAQQVRRLIEDVPGLVNLDDDCSRGKPEIQVKVDREQALLTGLSTEFVGLIVKAAVNGRKAGVFREGDKEYDVTVRFPEYFREDLANVETMNLINATGQAIPFSSVAHVAYGTGRGEITRIDRKRTVTVFSDVQGRLDSEVLADVQKRLGKLDIPFGYTISYTGEDEDRKETQDFLSRAFVVALLLVALVLVAQFNSILQTLVIMTSVILSLAGVFLGLLLFHKPFGILMTGIGCISLAGVVVNNAIVLLDFINKLRDRGMSFEDAIVEAGMTRFRPVMLTAITTVLGLVPMAVGISFDFHSMRWIIGGEMAQWWGSMAIAVIFGLSFATLLTLVVVPTLYSACNSFLVLFRKGSRQAA
jgi:multidrug efflux pump subunit AcrB